MAQSAKTRDDRMMEQINAPIELDLSIDMKLPRSNQTIDKKYKCTCCGDSWDTRKSHFSKTASILYQSNDGYLPICNTCRDRHFYKLVDLYKGNEAHAIRHFCQEFDIIFHEDALTASRQISNDRSRISHYQAKKNLGQTARIGSTYIDGMKNEYAERQDNIIQSKEQIKTNTLSVTASAVDRWGIGFTEADYKNLDEHYRMLKKNNPNADNNQEIFIKSLCNLNMLMIRALQAGDSKEYSSLVEQYSKTFTKAGLKTVEEKDSSNDEAIGVTLGIISQFTPEEFYMDKKLYDDWDKLGDYIDRHITRPIENIITGSTIRDKEYYVPDIENEDIDDELGDLDE